MENNNREEVQRLALEAFMDNPRARIIVSMRVGKSKIAIDAVKRLKAKKVLWVTPFSKLRDNDIPKEIEKWYIEEGRKLSVKELRHNYIVDFKIITWSSLKKERGYYDLIILDEEQFITKNNSFGLIAGVLNSDYLLSMTGAETESQEKHFIYSMLGLSVSYRYSISRASSDKIISNPIFVIVNVKMTKEEKNRYNIISTEAEMYKSQKHYQKRIDFIGTCNSKIRAGKKLIDSIPKDNRVLIFSYRKVHSEFLCDNFYHSSSSNNSLELFNSFKENKLSLVKSGGVGATYKKVNNIVIMQCNNNTNKDITQQIARGLVMFKDSSGKDNRPIVFLMNLKETRDYFWVQKTLREFKDSVVHVIEIDDYV